MKTVSKEDGWPILLEGMVGGDTGRAIEAQEARGQRSFLSSDTLPIEGTKPQRHFNYVRDGDSSFESIEEWMQKPDIPWFAEQGFELGPVVEGDDVFRYGRLPEGWAKEPTDHSMWSHVVDERGRQRAAVFYKAAFYDRSAHISVTPLEGPNGKAYEDHEFVLDESSMKYATGTSKPWCLTCRRDEAHRWHQPESVVSRGDVRLTG